jgi:hypothetical protein
METRNCSGFTIKDLVILLVLVGGGAALFLPAVLKSGSSKASKVFCQNRLHDIGLSFSLFAVDHANKYPMQLSTNEAGTLELGADPNFAYRHFRAAYQLKSPSPTWLKCPEDNQRSAASSWDNFGNTNLSYFLALDANYSTPSMILAGDRNISTNSSIALSTSEFRRIRWEDSLGLHGIQGHVLFSDGHVSRLDSDGLSNAVFNLPLELGRLLVP